jgi:hypothetical protein
LRGFRIFGEEDACLGPDGTEIWTKISIEFYKDGTDAVFKALME